MEAVSDFPDLDVQFSPDLWGPLSGSKTSIFENIPYAHFNKKERCSHAADFAQNPLYASRFAQRPRRIDESMQNSEFAYKYDVAEDAAFQLVDTSKAPSRGTKFGGPGGAGGRKNYTNINRNMQGGRGGMATGGRGQMDGRRGPADAGRGGRGGGGRGGGRGGRGGRFGRKMDRQPSLMVGGDWNVIEEFDLAQFNKLSANKPVVKDLLWCGHLDQYDEGYEKVSGRTPKTLRRVENKIFYGVTTTDDPHIERFAVDGAGNVFATDAILAHIMAAPRSVYSWDLVIQKVDGSIFFDKRADSNFDLLTVSETSNEPPGCQEDAEEYNLPEKLSAEATMITQNFSQQILKAGARKTFEENPYFEESTDGSEPASVAYRYRQFTLGSINIIARCELHGYVAKKDSEPFMTSYALNEWDSRHSGGMDWRQKIDTQKGAVLGTELKNNSCKLAKWTAQSILAGADLMKVGYVSRTSRSNPYDHQILSTQFFKPQELATNIALKETNIWGIIKMLIELLQNQEDGKYVLLKDPNRPMLRLYSVPLDAFESDEEGEGEEGEEGGKLGDADGEEDEEDA